MTELYFSDWKVIGLSPRDQAVNQQMRAQSRAALITAARNLFASEGYFNTRVKDIARQAGMSTGNLYWYFPTKEALLKAVLKDGFEAFGKLLGRAASGEEDADTKLRMLVSDLVRFEQQRGEFNTILLSLLGQGDGKLIENLNINMEKIGQDYTNSLISILAQAQQEGLLAADQDLWLLSMLFFGLFNGLNLTYSQQWLEQPEEDITAAVLRLLGISPSPGNQDDQ